MVNSSRDLTPQAITWDEIEKIKKRTKIGSKVTWKVLTGLVDNTMARYPTIANRLVLTGKYQFVATAVGSENRHYILHAVDRNCIVEEGEEMRFLDFFAGVGGFRKGLELSGHRCVGFCEWDKYAAASYTSMHLITDEQRKYLETFSLKQRQKEILKEEYRNGEWYSNDIRNVDAESLPDADCWCFGAPCQDFSIAGKRAGLDGDRSSLVREVFRILEEFKEEDRPEWIIYENVKGMLSSNRGLDYLSILAEMDRLGYDIEWQNINSKWWVPQNRERIYTIGHLRKYGSAKILPVTGSDGENNIHVIGSTHPNRHSTGDIHSTDGIMSCCASRDYKQPKQVVEKIIVNIKCININDKNGKERPQQERVYSTNGIMTALNAQLEGRHNISIPVLTPDRAEKRQNGRRLKENGKPMFTLTAQDRHGVALDIKSFYSKTRGKAEREGYAPTLDHNCNVGIIQKTNIDNKKESGIYVEIPGGFLSYCVWYEKYQCYIAIRRLTPKECFRLQGWTDDYFEKAAFVNSDSQLYKQAGNGVTVDVVRAIGESIREHEQSRHEAGVQ